MKLTKFQLGGVPSKKLESNDATPFMNFFKFLIPGFKLAYDQKLAQLNYDAKMKAQYRVRVPLQEVPTSVYKPKVLLAKKPKKNAPIALSKSITKHLFGTTKEGILPGGSNKSNRFVAQSVNSIPEVNVNGIDRRWHLDKRNMDLENGRGVSSEVFYDYYNGGNTWLGDDTIVKGGRTIYYSPKGNDTIYWNTPITEDGWNKHIGNMLVGSPLPGAKANFFKNLKRPLIRRQEGGPIEKADNTRIASGRPQLVLNRIPYGAGKGPAGEGPMRLFNDPYVNIGLMAMAPVAVRQHRNGVNYAPPTMKDIINNIKRTGLHGLPVNPEVGISLNSLMKYTGKSPEQINSIMLPKYGDMRIETLPNSKRQLGIWRIKGDKDLVLNEVLELLK